MSAVSCISSYPPWPAPQIVTDTLTPHRICLRDSFQRQILVSAGQTVLPPVKLLRRLPHQIWVWRGQMCVFGFQGWTRPLIQDAPLGVFGGDAWACLNFLCIGYSSPPEIRTQVLGFLLQTPALTEQRL